MRAVLMFHGVDRTDSVVSVRPEQLRSIVSAVRDAGHDVVPLSEVFAGSRRGVALTFDDGFKSVMEAADVLEDVVAPATLFLTTGYVGKDNRWPGQSDVAPTFEMMTWADVEALSKARWTIEAHSVSHPDLRGLDDAALEHELTGCRDAIADHTQRTPTIFAYPYGWFDRRVLDFTRRHYRAAVTTKMASLDDGPADPHQVPRLDAYYLRSSLLHRPFAGRRFSLYVGTRGFLRRLRAHPGEIEVEC